MWTNFISFFNMSCICKETRERRATLTLQLTTYVLEYRYSSTRVRVLLLYPTVSHIVCNLTKLYDLSWTSVLESTHILHVRDDHSSKHYALCLFHNELTRNKIWSYYCIRNLRIKHCSSIWLLQLNVLKDIKFLHKTKNIIFIQLKFSNIWKT
jgi:hypothetical protein